MACVTDINKTTWPRDEGDLRNILSPAFDVLFIQDFLFGPQYVNAECDGRPSVPPYGVYQDPHLPQIPRHSSTVS
jgi:hypothetical protein